MQSCCSPIASASAAARRLRPLRISCCSLARLQLLLPVCVRFQLLLPNCVRFDCCSPIACVRLQPQLDSSPMFSNILHGVRGSVNKLKYEGRASIYSPIANVQTSGNLMTAHGHFLYENGVFYIVQFKRCYFSPRRWRRVGLHCFEVSRSMVVVIAT